MTTITTLLQSVENARTAFITEASGLTHAQASYQPDPTSWSIVEIVEHIVRAEQSGISGLWKAFDGLQRGEPVWEGDPIHHGLSVEEIVDKTWQPKEVVPPIAAPQWGGSIAFWLAMLKAQRSMLADLGQALAGHDLKRIVYPHPISGPMDAKQRLEFLRFHLERHQAQIQAVKASAGYPT